jgi:quinol monooxygenase YgiN
MIHAIAIITTKPGMREALLKEFRANVPNVLKEKGCIEYGPTVDAATDLPIQTKLGPDTTVIVEKWETLEDLKAHGVAPHMKEYAAKVKDMLVSRTIHVLSPA